MKNRLFVVSARRPPPFGRRVEECVGAPACVAPFQRTLAQVRVGFSKNLWRLASRCPKMSPNLFIEAAPNRKTRFVGTVLPTAKTVVCHGAKIAISRMEHVAGIEPASPPWQGSVIATILYVHNAVYFRVKSTQAQGIYNNSKKGLRARLF